MKKIEEDGLLKDLESGKIALRKPTKDELAFFAAAADRTFKKDKRINIRLSSHDLFGIQKMATRKGLPYQALISALIHQYLEGDIVEKHSQ